MTIGITYTEHDDKFANYVRWMKAHHHEIEIVRLSPAEDHKVEELDGVILSGGVDIHPKYYGGAMRYDRMPKHFKEERDDFEFSVFDKALKNQIPVIGICRGLQLINVFQKGTLVQDLGNGNDTHKTYRAEGHEHDRTHNVTTQNDTLLKEIVGEASGHVNSAHHQCIQQLGEDLLINSYADDGTIEGIEWKNKNDRSFMLAVQWHPERMDKSGLADSSFSKNIREHFIDAIKSKVTT